MRGLWLYTRQQVQFEITITFYFGIVRDHMRSTAEILCTPISSSIGWIIGLNINGKK